MDDRQQAAERTRLTDYRVTFGTEAGQRVLKDLEERFLLQDARAHVSAGNTTGVVWIAGQGFLIGKIKQWCEKPVEFNMPMYLQPVEQGDPFNG